MILIASLCSIHMQAQTIDEIIDKNIAAMGGKEKLLALNSVSMEVFAINNLQDLPYTNHFILTDYKQLLKFSE